MKPGDRVIADYDAIRGKGVVVDMGTSPGYSGWWAVRFDEKCPYGHTCEGRIESGYGYWIPPHKLILDEVSQVKSIMESYEV